jgi:spore coat protein U-like protein
MSSSAALAIWMGSGSMEAAIATANLAVSASVANNCTISTAALGFGSYDPVSAHAATPLDGSGTVTIACTKGANTTISLDLGGNASGSQRRLKDGGTNFLSYDLFQDAGRTTVWGTGGDVLTPPAAPSKAPRNYSVYGRVPANQDVPAGNYTDTVVATVNF